MSNIDITLKLDRDQADEVFLTIAKDYFELLYRDGFKFEDDIVDAFKTVLQYCMTEHGYKTYMHSLAKNVKKYNSKRLTDANNGL